MKGPYTPRRRCLLTRTLTALTPNLRRILAFVCALAALIAFAAVTAPRAQATQSVPGPYWQTMRWGYPNICVANHLQTPGDGPGTSFQDIRNAWSNAADLTLPYGVGSSACTGYGNWERIDVETGFDVSKGCYYHYALYDANNKVKRMIVYLNYNRTGCWADGITQDNWYKSQALGVALGNQPFAFTDFANGYWVMATHYPACCSYSQPNDWHTFDYYNNL